MSANFNFGT